MDSAYPIFGYRMLTLVVGMTDMDDLLCPISWEMMEDPVMIEDGTVYDRFHIMDWFNRGNRTSPLTNEVVATTVITPVEDLRQKIKAYRIESEEGYTGCRHLPCRFHGMAPDFLCSEHAGRMEASRSFTDEQEVMEIMKIPSDAIMTDREAAVYEIFLRNIVAPHGADWTFLGMTRRLRTADTDRLYRAARHATPALQIYLVRQTLCPWLLDRDVFHVGLCYSGHFDRAPRRVRDLARFVHAPK